MNIATNEPVVSAATIAGAIGAILVALVSLKVVNLTPEQSAAIMAAVVAVLPIVMAFWARSRVTPLTLPTDIDGERLTRTDNSPALPELANLMDEAKKIDAQVSK